MQIPFVTGISALQNSGEFHGGEIGGYTGANIRLANSFAVAVAAAVAEVGAAAATGDITSGAIRWCSLVGVPMK